MLFLCVNLGFEIFFLFYFFLSIVFAHCRRSLFDRGSVQSGKQCLCPDNSLRSASWELLPSPSNIQLRWLGYAPLRGAGCNRRLQETKKSGHPAGSDSGEMPLMIKVPFLLFSSLFCFSRACSSAFSASRSILRNRSISYFPTALPLLSIPQTDHQGLSRQLYKKYKPLRTIPLLKPK